MPVCCAKSCGNHSQKRQKGEGFMYHLFPQDAFRRVKWIDAVREERQDEHWIPSNASILCGDHFIPEDLYVTPKGRRRIKNTALPIFWNLQSTSQEAIPLIEEDSSNESTSSLKIMKEILLSTSRMTEQQKGEPDSSSLDKVEVSDLESILETPRKKYLRKKIIKQSLLIKKQSSKIRVIQRRNLRLKKKNASLSSILQKLKQERFIPEDIRSFLSSNIKLVESQNRIYKKKKDIAKYPPSLRKFALTLNFYSPSAYKYVRRVFNTSLPHPRTLNKWYQSIDGNPGFTAESFTALSQKAKSVNSKLICSLTVDEMAIRQQKIWDGSKFLGLVNKGTGIEDSGEIATQAYVLMLVSITENWKLPLGYFLINGLSAEDRANILKICLRKCDDVGVDVISLTFDGCSANIGAVNILGCNFENVENLKTTFKHPSNGQDVAVLLDACHMIKLIRNTFESKKQIFDNDGNEIRWDYLVKLNKLQEDQNLHFANKLTSRHVYFRNQIMKVKLATQLLSKSVANALKLCWEEMKLPMFKDSTATIIFITIINNVFDVLNSRNRRQRGFKHPLFNGNKEQILKFLDEAKTYIINLKIKTATKRTISKRNSPKEVKITTSLKRVVETRNKTGFLGLLVCIESVKALYKNLIEIRNDLSFLAKYKLSQDHIELFFGNIRKHGGSNNNPNARQFKGIYRKMLNYLELRPSFNGNCIPLENFSILNCSSAIKTINDTSTQYRFEEDCEVNDGEPMVSSDLQAYNNCQYMSSMLDNTQYLSASIKFIIGYISGFVVKALIKKIKCEKCINSLTSIKKMWFHKLISIKDLGGLCYPATVVFIVCSKTESVIRQLIKESGIKTMSNKYTFAHMCSKSLKQFINTNILNDLHEHSFDQPATFNHRLQLIRAIIEKYINIRLHYLAKTDPALKTSTKRQQFNKLVIFDGK